MKIYDRDVIKYYLDEIYEKNYQIPETFVDYSICNITNSFDIRPIAYYLPQFYPTEINNQNWGRGFTEWTNVASAKPQFKNHYQPHIPEYLGYYNLSYAETLFKQCRLAKEYGIYGFCFYYYYLENGPQLKKPLELFLHNKEIHFPFCICWANENWTRNWDGKMKNVIARQSYSDECINNTIESINRIFCNENYIRIDNHPLLIIYNAEAVPNLESMLDYWKNICTKSNISEPYFVCALTFNIKKETMDLFDACVQFPPHGIHLKQRVDYSSLVNPNFSGQIYYIQDYIDLLKDETNYKNIYYCAFTAWDNTPRVSSRAKIFSDSSPETFSKWLDKIISYTVKRQNKHSRYIFINAWNEWGEGAHLEPDRKYGYAYLDVLRRHLLN